MPDRQEPLPPSPWAPNPRLDDVIAERVDTEASDGWLLRHQLTPQERADSLRRVFLNGQPRWASAFAIMLVLASGVAALGLSQNSAATVIGSMIIAPLGQPIVALGAAVVMGWVRETGRLALVIILGALAVAGVSFVIGILLPDSSPTDQVLARTAPDLRDMGVALLAGAAGAYAYSRDELSGVLPGVAIAVALVPPLGAFGLLLESWHPVLAAGAALLFATNLVGITAAAGAVMLATGFAPRPRFRRLGVSAVAAVVASVAALIALIVLLGGPYSTALSAARTVTELHAAVGDAIGSTGPTVLRIRASEDEVDVTVADDVPVDSSRIEQAVKSVVGPNTLVRIEPAS